MDKYLVLLSPLLEVQERSGDEFPPAVSIRAPARTILERSRVYLSPIMSFKRQISAIQRDEGTRPLLDSHFRYFLGLTRPSHLAQHFAIMVNEVDTHIGSVSLMQINHREQNAELGIAIGDKSQWGKGLRPGSH